MDNLFKGIDSFRTPKRAVVNKSTERTAWVTDDASAIGGIDCGREEPARSIILQNEQRGILKSFTVIGKKTSRVKECRHRRSAN
jgi:hypothetical protein